MSLQDDLVASFSWVDGHANIWPWFANTDLFAAIVEGLARPIEGDRVTRVVGNEARAFLLAGAVARRLNAGVVPIRKRGALFPGELVSTNEFRTRIRDDVVTQEGFREGRLLRLR